MKLKNLTRTVALASLIFPVVSYGDTFFSESFDGLEATPGLSPFTSPSEGGGDGTDWTDLATAQGSGALPGWTMIRNTGHGSAGVTEFDGWTFFDPDSWVSTAGDQGRSEFTKGSGVIAVADSDEFDDTLADSPFDATLTTPSINIAGAVAGSLMLVFDSSWNMEPQLGTVTVAYDGGDAIEVLRYDENTARLTNQTVSIPLDNPASANEMTISWTKAGRNNWWWAIDNIRVTGESDVTSFSITDVSYLDGADTLSITWESSNTETYRIQTSTTGTGGTFTDATGDISGEAGTTTISISVTPQSVPTLLVRVVQK